jgi:hypothetical protein
MRFQANTKRTTLTIQRSLYIDLKHQDEAIKNERGNGRPARWCVGNVYHVHRAYLMLTMDCFKAAYFFYDRRICKCSIHWMYYPYELPCLKYYSAEAVMKPRPWEEYRLVFDCSKWTLEAFRL